MKSISILSKGQNQKREIIKPYVFLSSSIPFQVFQELRSGRFFALSYYLVLILLGLSTYSPLLIRSSAVLSFKQGKESKVDKVVNFMNSP